MIWNREKIDIKGRRKTGRDPANGSQATMKQNAITTTTKGEEEAWHLVKETEHQRETERLVAQGKTKEEADKAKKSLARAD